MYINGTIAQTVYFIVINKYCIHIVIKVKNVHNKHIILHFNSF